jgi:hypothetical protein
MVIVNWSVSDSANYLVEANSPDDARNKIMFRFPRAHISGTFMLEQEVIK